MEGGGFHLQPTAEASLKRVREGVAGHHEHAPAAASGIHWHFAWTLIFAHLAVLIEHLDREIALGVCRRAAKAR